PERQFPSRSVTRIRTGTAVSEAQRMAAASAPVSRFSQASVTVLLRQLKSVIRGDEGEGKGDGEPAAAETLGVGGRLTDAGPDSLHAAMRQAATVHERFMAEL